MGLAIKLETVCRSLCDCQSKPKSTCRLEVAVRRHDSLASREQTRNAGQRAFAQVEATDEPDSDGIFGKPSERQYELPQAARNRVSRSRLFLWMSLSFVKVDVGDFGKLLRPGLELTLYLVAEG
jgi:hypothetical protein